MLSCTVFIIPFNSVLNRAKTELMCSSLSEFNKLIVFSWLHAFEHYTHVINMRYSIPSSYHICNAYLTRAETVQYHLLEILWKFIRWRCTDDDHCWWWAALLLNGVCSLSCLLLLCLCVCVWVCFYMSLGLRHPSARTGHSCDRRAVVPSYLISFSFINAVRRCCCCCCSASGDCAAVRSVGGGGRPLELWRSLMAREID